MEFKEFNDLLMNHVRRMTEDQEHLFVVDDQKGELWETYLSSFPEGTNKVFRERREFDCNCCHNFMRDFGNVVAIKDGSLITAWDFETGSSMYQPVVDALASYVRARSIRDVLIPAFRKFGTKSNTETLANGEFHTWHHLYVEVSASLQIFKEDQVGTIRGSMRDSKNVLKRSFDEISNDAIETVRDLIAQKSLYKGEEWDKPLELFHGLHRAYHAIDNQKDRDIFCWKASVEVGTAMSRIKNHSIGVLLTDVTGGMDLNDAVKRYEKIVAPSNYKRPKAIFTKKMISDAQATVKELGLEGSLGRRYARLSDITVNNILFANRDTAKKMAGDAFDEMAESIPEKIKRFEKVEEVPVDDFVKNILPTAKELEVLLENDHSGNMVSLIAPTDKDAPSMFKWNNGFSWAYSGNITDSMKERVKSMGGKVDGDLRFSIQWNERNDSNDDLDARSYEANGNCIYFAKKGYRHSSSGMLDVDVVHPGQEVAVENITWSNRRNMAKGIYKMVVHCFSSRGAKSGFSAEIEFDGKIYSFNHSSPLRQSEVVEVAKVEFDGENFKLESSIPSQESSREIWGIMTNTFHPVSAFMYSPNYWDNQDSIGHRHYMFLIGKCKNPESPNGFFNEFLREDLMKHKRVFEAMGSKMRVEDSNDQLSGLGFSATKRASVTCRVKGSFTRMIKVIF